MNRRIAVVVLLLSAAVGAVLGYRYLYPADRPRDVLTLYGNVDLREVGLAFTVQERVRRVLVEEGDVVRRGELLAELDPVRLEAGLMGREAELEAVRQQLLELERGSRPEEIVRARAELAAARASQREAELRFQRIERLVREKLASPQSRDDAQAALDTAVAKVDAAEANVSLVVLGAREEVVAVARSRVRAAEAAVAAARKDLEDTRLLAPSDGTIQARVLEPGDVASPQRPVLTLALTDPLWVRAYVSEADLGRVRSGALAEVSTDSFPGKIYRGRVGYVSPSAEFTPKSVQTTDVRSSLVYQVRVLVSEGAGELRLGMPATVRIPLTSASAPDGASGSGRGGSVPGLSGSSLATGSGGGP